MDAPIEGGGERVRQWRVRQANGNQFTVRELTTLQRWIVEHKLSRDDEVSLDGESWKQLGRINELSSFFQLVDEAQRAILFKQSSREPASATVANETTSSLIPPKGKSGPVARFEMPGLPGLPPEVAEPFTRVALKGGPNRGLFIVLLLVFLGGVSYLAYRYFVWVPQSKRSSAGESAPAKAGGAEPAQLSAGEMSNPPPQSSSKPEEAANFDGYLDKADRLREREQPRAALQAYQKAHELEPARAEPLAGRGLALLDLGRTASAIAAFERALKIAPRHETALMGLAEAYRAEGKKEQAVRYYEKYLAVAPDGPEAQVARAAIEALQE